MWNVLRKSIGEAHSAAVKTVIENGEFVETEHGTLTIELDSVLVTEIEQPLCDPLRHRRYKYTQPMLDEYAFGLLSPVNTNGFEYTYGERLNAYGAGFNQIQCIIEKLQNQPMTRQAIAITWQPYVDNYSKWPPCLQSIQLVNRAGELNMTAYFRSNDICQALGANAYGLSKVQDMAAQFLNVKVGKLTIVSNCAHIYMSDIQDARAIAYG